MRRAPAVALAFLAWLPAASGAQEAPRRLDDFEDLAGWTAVASDGVGATLRQVDGPSGRALCLDYDFHGVSGYAVARRALAMTYPANYEFALQLRGSGPTNNLEFKLGDASGDNVWWVNRPNFPLPAQWTPTKLKKRHIAFAWGPAGDKVLRASSSFEMTISAGKGGGRGEACVDELTFRVLPPEDAAPPAPVARASASLRAGAPAAAVDGDATSAWRASRQDTPELVLDLGRSREFGGITLEWAPGLHASGYRVALSDDGRAWRGVRTVEAGNGGRDPIALPESEARWLRLQLVDGPGREYALADLRIEPLAFAATPNDFLEAVASAAPRGWWPRGFVGEQSYWTLLGIDGGGEQGLLDEDGAIELARGGFRVEPFVLSGGRLLGWADAGSVQSLQDRYLPIPTVRWTHPEVGLAITAFAQGTPGRSQLLARYVLTNPTTAPRDYTLALAVRPLQVNPPSQFLNTTGGFSRIDALAFDGSDALVGGVKRLRALAPPDAAFATPFDAGEVVERLASGALPAAREAVDPTGLASGAWLYRVHLQPGESREVAWIAPLTGALPDGPVDAAAAQGAVAAQWHAALDRVGLRVPAGERHVVDTLRTALAHMLMSRAGPRLQPGTRSYARAWIRDGAMISEALLRMGRADVAGDFVRWYAPYQFDTGKVPCCVDDRGSDPVPENDSHGELVFAVAEVYRHTRDRAFLEAMWPHVEGAVRYMDTLRASERTDANRARNRAFFGLMPASISHEGYSAKPMHSYWDDFWALRGYRDAVEIATWLGRGGDARRIAASRDEFAADLQASLRAAMAQAGIDFLPGSAELGDFDATSTTIALAPGGEQANLPPDALQATFGRYWREFVARRDGTRAWKDYTPYELRTIGTFVRLGWRDRAHEALDFFFAGQQPRGWNQWAEVVSRTPRTPFFVGDLPHAWVESDYVRSVLDMFAYERARDGALVLAAGIPAGWLAGEGIAVDGLRTPGGPLSYSLRDDGRRLRLDVQGGLTLPPGGLVFPWKGRETRIRRVPATLELPR